jgi:hypothetical protein
MIFVWNFIKKFWDMFHDLHNGVIPLFSLNFGVTTLVPKVQDANKIQQYRAIAICLLNVSFKIFTNVATLHVNSVAYMFLAQHRQPFPANSSSSTRGSW